MWRDKNTNSFKCLSITLAVAFLFSTTYIPSSTQAYTITESNNKIIPARQFQVALQEIEELLKDISEKMDYGEDATLKSGELKTKRQAIENLNQEIQQEFAQTEEKLKAAGVSSTILQRHHDFVSNYNTKFSVLLTNLNNVEDAKADRVKVKERINQAMEHIKKNRHKKKQISFNNPTHKLKKVKQAPQQEEQALLNQPIEDTTIAVSTSASGQSPDSLLSNLLNFFTNQAEAASPQYAEYLGQSIEVQITQEIIDLASSLDNNPIKIYQFVRNNFKYEPYYGSLKGAIGTLHDQAGNDFDQASLLITLLRSASIPAKYVYGQVEIPIDRVKSWVGIDDPWRVADLLVTYGIPATTIVKGGQPSAIRIEHCWVEAYVDYFPSGGVIHKEGDTWIPLDPSFKLQNIYEPEDISAQVSFNTTSYLSKVQTGDALDFYMDQLETYLEQNIPDKILSQMGRIDVNVSEDIEVLPASLPYKKISTITTYAEIPDDKRYQIKVTVPGDEIITQDLIYQTSLPAINGKRLTLSYTGTQSPYTNPAYTVTLQPTIKLDGVVQVTGDPVSAGQDQQVVIELIMPNQGTERIQNEVIAGEFQTLVCTWPSSNGQAMMEMSRRLNQNITDLGDAFLGSDGFLKEDLTGDFLYLRGKSWFTQVGLSKELASSFMHLPMFQDIGYASVSVEVDVDYLFGVPYTMSLSGLMIDADRNISAVVPKSGEEWKTKEYMTLTGYASSALEHFIWEQKYEPGAVSAVKAIQIANEQGIPVYDIDSSNVSLIDTLAISEDVKTDMRNAINAGHVVKTPSSNITHAGWTGVGYIVHDPATGAGSYEIAGGSATAAGGWFFMPSIIPYSNKWALAVQGYDGIPWWNENPTSIAHVTRISKLLSRLGYDVVYGRVQHKNRLLSLLGTMSWQIFYFHGHGSGEDYNTTDWGKAIHLLKDSGDDKWLFASEIAPMVQETDFKIVLITACAASYRSELSDAFGIIRNGEYTTLNEAFIAPDRPIAAYESGLKAEKFFAYLVNNNSATVQDAYLSVFSTQDAYLLPYSDYPDDPNIWLRVPPDNQYWRFRP